MVEEGGDVSAFESFTTEDAGGDKKDEGAKTESSEASEPADSGSKTAPKSEEPAIKAQESESTGARLETALQREPKISPAAKRLALEKGVPVTQLKGTGPGGQITKADVEKFQGTTSAPAAAAGAAYEDTPATSMRK